MVDYSLKKSNPTTKNINRDPDADKILSVQKKAKVVNDPILMDDFYEITPIEKNAELDYNSIVSTIIKQDNESHNIAEEESTFDCSTPLSSLRKPVTPKLKRMIKKSPKSSYSILKRALREKKLSVLKGLHDLELEKIRQSISQQKELYEQVMRHKEEKQKLEIRKLQLEIEILKKKVAQLSKLK